MNQVIRTLICQICNIAILPQHVTGHIKEKHSDTYINIDQIQLTNICEELDVMDVFPELGYGPIDELEGLLLRDGIKCLHCSKPLGEKTVMQKHHGKYHPDIPTPKEWPAIKMQQLNPGHGRSYFEVIPKTRAIYSDTDIVIHNLRKDITREYNDEDDDNSTINTRMVSPWLMTTKWHEHVQGYNIMELQNLVKSPKNTEFPGLQEAVLWLLQEATRLIGETPELVLQRLNTSDPAKTYVISYIYSYRYE